MNYAIGIDLGGTNIKYGIAGDDGSILFESILNTEAEKGREQVLLNIRRAVNESLVFAQKESVDITGIGVGTPGIVDDGCVLGGAENLPEWEDLQLAEIINSQFNLPVYVDNDANLLGLAQVSFGDRTNEDDIVFLTIGTGIGGAMVINGQLYGGHRNRGAELGHVIVDINGEKCSCGARGCLEAHGSVTSLIRDYKALVKNKLKQNTQNIDGRYIVQKYQQKEDEAIKAMNRHFDYLAAGIAGFINIFSPQKIVIGGGISDAGEFYIRNIRERALKIAMKETSVFTKIERALFGNKAGFLGAVALVFSKNSTFV